MNLNLDRNFKPFDSEEIQFEHFLFAGGEPHIRINPNFDKSKNVTVTHRLNSFNDLGLLCLAVDALQRLGAKLGTLVIPYFPAARQDRVMVKGEALSVKVYAQIINTLNFEKVLVFDPHSDVTPAVLANCEVISNHAFIQRVIGATGNDVVLISPDGGALKKIYKTSEFLGGIEVVECSKSRDIKTGKLTGFKAYTDNLHQKACLIVDDICDGGGTFVGLAKELQNKNAGKLYLAVSHGIFSQGFQNLKCFERIFTTDSIKNLQIEGLTQIKLNSELLS